MAGFGVNTLLVPNEVTNNQAGLLALPGATLVSGALPLLASGEGGAVLADGTVLFTTNPTETYVNGVAIYAAGTVTPVATPAVFTGLTAWDTFSPCASDFASTFYVSYHDARGIAASLIKAVSAAGVVGALYTLSTTGLAMLAVDQANTTFYYGTYDLGSPIKRWNLASDTALPDLPIPAVVGTNFWVPSGLVLVPGTNSLLALAEPNQATPTVITLVRYSTVDGSILNTYAIVNDAAGFSSTRLSVDVGNPSTRFWLRSFEDRTGAVSHFTQYDVATGAILQDYPAVPSDSSDPTKTPVSCPFFGWTPPSGPPPPPAPAPLTLGPGTPVPFPTPLSRATLVLDMRVLGATTRWFPDQYTPPVTCRDWEPGLQVHDAVLGTTTGAVVRSGGTSDQGGPIAYGFQVPDFTADDPRRVKAFGDLVIDVDPQHSVGITLLPAGNNFTQPLPAPLVGAGASGRQLFVVDIAQGLGYLARSLGIRLTGADTVAPVFYLWEPSFVLKVEDTVLRATDWDDASYFGAKFVQGLLLEIDTSGQPRTVQVEYDQGLFSEPFTVNPGPLQSQVPYSFQQPLVGAHLLRLVALNQEFWRFYRLRWVWEPMPEAVSVWETQPTTLDLPGYSQEERILIAHMSTSDFVVTVTADGVSQTYPVANSGGLFVKTEILEAPNKGKVYTFRAATVDGSQSLRIFMKDLEVRHRAWGGGAYESLRPFGDVSREHGGARI
jgi:hypothetical protein